nr:retrovirus-related Pol polyprotein from transposon TNT 1-94 [Tanacetum cinerariifolium]
MLDKRDPDDKHQYLLATWPAGETQDRSLRLEEQCSSSEPCNDDPRDKDTILGTILVFADDDTSEKPLVVPRKLLLDLTVKTLYCGTSISTIFQAFSTQEVGDCFWEVVFLQGQDLWDLVAGEETIPADIPANADLRRKWKETLERLFSKKYTARLQFLENELAVSTQGWEKQPSVEELENLLANQEALARQIAKNIDSDAVLFSKGKNNKKHTPSASKKPEGESSARKSDDVNSRNHKGPPKSYRCVVERRDNTTIKPMPDLVLYNEESCKKEWIVDSGSSHHVTGNASLLSEIRQHKEEWVIITADDSTHPVEKERVVKIKAGDEGAVKLEDVYHVPGLKRNLVSVPQITDSGKYVLFGPSGVKILVNVRNLAADVIVTSEKKGSLFVLSAGEAYVKKTSQNDSAALSHACLGHIGYQLLLQISSKRLLKKSINRKSTMFELVHTDLMGPMKPSSYSGYCYVMVLVDDFSKYTWVKFLKKKSEALSVFVEFKKNVEKESG